MSQLPLDHDQWDPLAGHLDRMGVQQGVVAPCRPERPAFGGGRVIRFYPRLAALLDGTHADFLYHTTDANCPGDGQAARGYLCVYTYSTTNVASGSVNTYYLGYGADTWGAEVFVTDGTLSHQVQAVGDWAVTAP